MKLQPVIAWKLARRRWYSDERSSLSFIRQRQQKAVTLSADSARHLEAATIMFSSSYASMANALIPVHTWDKPPLLIQIVKPGAPQLSLLDLGQLRSNSPTCSVPTVFPPLLHLLSAWQISGFSTQAQTWSPLFRHGLISYEKFVFAVTD